MRLRRKLQRLKAPQNALKQNLHSLPEPNFASKIEGLRNAGCPQAGFFETTTKIRKTQMSVEQTLSIIKPDGVQKNLIGEIYSRFEKAGLQIVAARMLHLSKSQAEGFYAVHSERPFFNDLVKYMTSGPVMVQALEGESAINKNREIMGATNPADADPGTVRADFADSIEENIVHGSDAAETAADEIAFFFGDDGICPRTR
jgi:nucleoside-diphosphate kinase